MNDTELTVKDSCKPGGNDASRHSDAYLNGEIESKVGADWPDPCPLPESLLAVDPFNLDLIPEKLRPWVADVTERMQCPADFAAASLMTGLGSLIGRKVVIRPQVQNDWQESSNMWAILIGRPGVLKSPAMKEALRPLTGNASAFTASFRAVPRLHGFGHTSKRFLQDACCCRALRGSAQTSCKNTLNSRMAVTPTKSMHSARL
jgi:hypothetical protein